MRSNISKSSKEVVGRKGAPTRPRALTRMAQLTVIAMAVSIVPAVKATMTTTHAVILGILLSTSAVVGDLIESIFKREAGVKDSGSFFPGIGGILDLLDSLLFNAPLMYLYLRHVLTHPATKSIEEMIGG